MFPADSMKKQSLFWLGKSYAKDLLDEKSVYLLNAACLIWHGANLFLLSLGWSMMPEIFNSNSLFLISMHTMILIVVQVLQSKGSLKIARAVFLISAFMVFFVYDYFVLPGYNISFYYIIPVLLSQLLFKERAIHIVLLIISIVLFFDFFTPQSMNFSQLHFVNYFIALFFIVDLLIKVNSEKQELLFKQKLHLEELNRFQSSFFVNLSHEIKTPLTLIQGTVSAMRNGNKEGAEELIERQSTTINTLVDDMIVLNKLQMKKLELKKELVDLTLLIQKIYASFLSEFERKGVSFQVETDNSYAGFYDPVYFERALNNILINALKYTCSGEVVISIKKNTDEKLVDLIIKDSGIGISDQEINQVMERFYQGDNPINKSCGTGIGLSFSKELVELHGGTLSLKSHENVGTEVIITVPYDTIEFEEKVSLESSVIDDVIAQRLENNISENYCILVAEDNPDMQEYLSRVLINYEVDFCFNGEEAFCRLHEKTYDLLITDYMMPKMDGRELINKLNQELNLPIIMLTARSDIRDKLDLLRLGIDDYITKPFNENELLVRIDKSLRNFNSRKEFISEHNVDVALENDSPFIHKLREYIEKNCGSLDFGVNIICDEFGLSNSSLYRKVKSHTGLTTQGLIKEVKLKKAHSLILNKEVETIKEVSHIVGFGKPSYFTEVYANAYGCKPFHEGKA